MSVIPILVGVECGDDAPVEDDSYSNVRVFDGRPWMDLYNTEYRLLTFSNAESARNSILKKMDLYEKEAITETKQIYMEEGSFAKLPLEGKEFIFDYHHHSYILAFNDDIEDGRLYIVNESNIDDVVKTLSGYRSLYVGFIREVWD